MATLTHSQLEDLWIVSGGAPGTADTAAAIAQAESGGCQYSLAGPVDIRPVKECTWTRTSRENSCGFWQINLYAHPSYSAPTIFEELVNARAAVAISNAGSDFGAWTTYVDGAYKQYLTSGGVPTPQPGTTAPPDVLGLAPSGHHGWADLRNTINHHLPTQTARSQALRNAALRSLGARPRVGR